MKTVHIDASRSYDVRIGRGLLDDCGRQIAERVRCASAAVVADDTVYALYGERVCASLEAAGVRTVCYVFPHGEKSKNLLEYAKILNFLAENRVTRADALIALGGGVTGDLGGFAAATYLRGIPFVQLPTTLLAQVDSSVGGKVAVDLPQGKNLVGAFYQPELVLVDPDSLRTLTDDFWRDGLGEVVKYGCIGDEALFRLLEENAGGGRIALMGVIGEILTHCIQYKANIVAQDEHDTGLRMTLNFGHTIAHAVETCQHYTGMRHGEAVALGMRVITAMTEEKGMTEQGTSARLNRLLDALGMPRQLPAIREKDLMNAMTLDKKSAGKQLRVITLDKIGVCRIVPTDVDFFQGMTAQKFVQN